MAVGEGGSFEEVARKDEQFKQEEKNRAWNSEEEEHALREMFEGASNSLVASSCAASIKTPCWEQCKEIWMKIKNDQVGERAKHVVQELEAEHLRPTGILDRLRKGVNPACFGLHTLMKHLDR
ncbi:hypothetical protein GUITHDRAFT_146271 [Guillardia theta CCMP2712]|uniref:Uncharacterized protein n=1 Tax=Guillardia theta (strain CCMP2712) TaxID=905079 RepID=L1IHH8_GUITC|nr:hypothetical protein GUITHDRAFT_146271 [Guillardia theta CCMP2712]EKX35706.1 hypothetical protein GUITHDRAFT_146271 [Guillardia theta CCMP2712]|eukprot:XP_005822686.1 hypothetical protein GUITHDRAFT_146271 [Guillardia theta CCMP2712]